MKAGDVPIGVAFCCAGGVFLRIFPEDTYFKGDVCVVAVVLQEATDWPASRAWEITPFDLDTEVELYTGDK